MDAIVNNVTMNMGEQKKKSQLVETEKEDGCWRFQGHVDRCVSCLQVHVNHGGTRFGRSGLGPTLLHF